MTLRSGTHRSIGLSSACPAGAASGIEIIVVDLPAGARVPYSPWGRNAFTQQLLMLEGAIAGIEAANAASISLHASLGFVEVGGMLEVGWKFGRFQAGGALYQAHGFVLSGPLERYREDHSLFLTLDLSGS